MHFSSETWLCGFGVLVAIVLRCGTSFHPYSGQGKPPMYGDYEAQRHWMEITVNLPPNQWYQNTTQNDLLYWGLDYPPLTAYHSYICGLIACMINSDYVALGSSRGYESEEHKVFMRYTVLFADILLFIPSVILYFILSNKVVKKSNKQRKKAKRGENQKVYISAQLAIILSLFYPGLILIDHGHFQYNCVSLAFAVFAITFILTNRNIIASIFFCLALNYKQMELYHSLPFFIYLLSTCVPKPGQNTFSGIKKLVKLTFTVVITFAIIWIPFLFNINDALQLLHRLFPVARGVFEDKVANIWCTLNIFYKFKVTLSNYQMVRYCTIATMIAVLPSTADLFLKPNVKKFLPALINSSLAFFLFSFQVHEKSILLAAIPVTLYIQLEPIACFWFLLMSIFSMFPLLVSDELVLAFIALTVFYSVVFRLILQHSNEKSPNFYTTFLPSYANIVEVVKSVQTSYTSRSLYNNLIKHQKTLLTLFRFIAISISLSGCLLLMLAMLIFEPPENYPDIFPLLISVYSCLHFLAFFVYFNLVQFKIPQAMEDVRHIKND